MRKLLTLAIAAALLLANCGGSSESPDPASSEITIGHFRDLTADFESVLSFVHDSGALAWATVESVTDSTDAYEVSFSIDEIIWLADGQSLAVGEVLPSPSFTQRQFSTAKAANVEVGDTVLAGIVDGTVETIAKPTADGRFFQPDSGFSYHILALAEVSDFADHVASAPALPCSPAGEPEQAMSYMDAIVSFLDGTTARQGWQQRQRNLTSTDKIADDLVLETPEQVDAVLGETVPHNDYDIIQQLLDGVDPGEVVVRPTVPVYWDVAELTGTVNLVVASADLKQLLGLVELTPTMSSGFDANPTVVQTFIGAPWDQSDVGIWIVEPKSVIGCQIPSDYLAVAGESSSSQLTGIPFDGFAGSTRALIEVGPVSANALAVSAVEIADLEEIAR